MTRPVFPIIFLFSFFSCNDTEKQTPPEIRNETVRDSLVNHEIKEEKRVNQDLDTVHGLVTDDYPITDGMLKSNYGKRTSGKVLSFDKAWFYNDTLKQSLVFDLYTDYHRLTIYHFLTKNIPASLLDKMELYLENGEHANSNQIQKSIDGFLSQAAQINSSYFITNKGLKIGDSKQKVISVYGNPDLEKKDGDVETLEWRFNGDILNDINTGLSQKRLARDSYGYQVIIFFRANKIVGQILHNDIP